MATPIGILELRSVRGVGGGPEKTILHGAELSDRRRFAVTVCYVRDARDDVFGIDARATRLGLDYVEVRERHSFDHRIWRKLLALVQERRIDIVHAHDYKTDLIALLLARQSGIIPLATAHGWTGQSSRERFAYYPADQWLLRRFPRVIAVSSEIKQQLQQRRAAPDRITVLLNGIDPEAFRRHETRCRPTRTALGFADDEIVIGAVGRLERQKRFDVLLHALAALLPTRPALRLAIAGDGSLRDDLEALASQLGISGRCRWLGHRHDIGNLHHAFDLFVQSSEYEGTPNAVLEAMAMETPIIATDVGGTRELAAHGADALLVPARDSDALAVAIQATLDYRQAARTRARNARHRIEADLSFGARTRALERIYEELVGHRISEPPRERAAVMRA